MENIPECGPSIKKQLLASVDSIYYRGLRNRYTGYTTITTRQIFDHLYAQYGEIGPDDLEENEKRLKQPYEATENMELLYDQIEDAIEFADNAQQPYSPEQVLRIAYNLIFKCGEFERECEKWTEKDARDKTWANFKAHFTRAHKRMRDSKASAGSAGFGRANAVIEETATQLANLAQGHAVDRQIIQGVQGVNATILQEVNRITTALEAVVADIAALRLQNNPQGGRGNGGRGASGRGGGNQGRGRGGRGNAQRTVRQHNNDNYCWTHGHDLHTNQTSVTCNWPTEGHQTTATKTNTMNGSDRRVHLVE